MSNVTLKNQPKITLEHVIKRRKTSLKQFVKDAGVQTYNGLLELCNRLGVAPVTEEQYKKEIKPLLVTSQEDGIVVIEPIEVIEEQEQQLVLKKKNLRKKNKEEEDLKNEPNSSEDIKF